MTAVLSGKGTQITRRIQGPKIYTLLYKIVLAQPRNMQMALDILKNVKDINLRLIFPNPMSRPVAAPQGPMRVK